jgi:hypothetical protein
MGKRKVSMFSILVLIIGISGLGVGVYSLYNYQQLINQVEPPRPLVRVFSSSSSAVPVSTYDPVNFNMIDFDVTGDFNIVTDRFIAPISGYYLVSVMVTYTPMYDGEYITAAVFSEGALKAACYAQASHTSVLSASLSDIVYLNSGEYLEIRSSHSGASPRFIYGDSAGAYTYLTITAVNN